MEPDKNSDKSPIAMSELRSQSDIDDEGGSESNRPDELSKLGAAFKAKIRKSLRRKKGYESFGDDDENQQQRSQRKRSSILISPADRLPHIIRKKSVSFYDKTSGTSIETRLTPTPTTSSSLDESAVLNMTNVIKSTESTKRVLDDNYSVEKEMPDYKSESMESENKRCWSCCLPIRSRSSSVSFPAATPPRGSTSTGSTETSANSSTTSSDSSTVVNQRMNPISRAVRRIKKSKYTKLSYYRNNLSFHLTVLVYFLVQAVLVLIQMRIYKHVNPALKAARAGGILLDFNSGLIVFLVLRRFVTWLRNSFVGRHYLPVDHFIKFHKIIGVLLLVYSIIHIAGHMVNLYWLSDEYKARFHQPEANSTVRLHGNETHEESGGHASYAELLFTTKSKLGWVYATAMPTGWALVGVLLIIEFFSMSFIRRKGFFQVFYYTHWLHLIYYVLLFLHAENFWKWFLIPAIFMLFEHLYTYYRVKSASYGETYIKDVHLLSSKVTQLIITRPPNFKFRCGDYLLIKIPKIARSEWHPFTISSAPELKDELWLHVRSLGNWTNKLYEHFQEISQTGGGFSSNTYASFSPETKYEKKLSKFVVMIDYKKSGPDHHSHKENNPDSGKAELGGGFHHRRKHYKKVEKTLIVSNTIKDIWMNVKIDGPYSTASRRIVDSEHVILIAGGIGVTPFASILQSLWFKYSKSLKTCPQCTHQWYDILEQKNLKRVDFIWVNRDYQAFEWFIELLGQLELQQINSKSERFIGIHLYMTSAKVVQEIKPLESPDFDKNGQIESKINDFVFKINPGRPDFDTIFDEISSNKKGKEIDVFFCGNREFGRFVQKKCLDHKFKFFKEYF